MLKSLKFVAILGGCLVASAAISGAIGAMSKGPDAYLASGVAAVVVWLAGSAVLVIASLPSEPFARLNALLLGMLIRVTLPLLAAVALTNSSQRLSEAGVAGYLLLHYLVGLAIETPMLLRFVKTAEPSSVVKNDGGVEATA